MIETLAQMVVNQMLSAGFVDAQVFDTETRLTEVNIDTNRASLLRSTSARKLTLQGMVNGAPDSTLTRKVSGECSDLSDQGIAKAIENLLGSAASAPESDSYSVSEGQFADIEQGPLEPDLSTMTQAAAGLLVWRAKAAPLVKIGGAAIAHQLEQRSVASSRGTLVLARMGSYSASVFANASDATRSSSFDMAGGSTHRLSAKSLQKQFGIKKVLSALPAQMETTRLTQNFVGDVVLSAQAVQDVLAWLISQLSDGPLLAGTSTLAAEVGSVIASPKLTVRSRFKAPGVLAVSSEGYVCKPIKLIKAGRLTTLLPSDYAGRKLKMKRVPVPAAPGMFPQPHGWEIDPGKTSLKKMINAISHGALVGRFSMGMPAANGDFSGVIKNSFLIENGVVGESLSETMVAGNMRQMLKDIVQISQERVDTGAFCLPSLRITGMKFS